jgi:hypothetical protein
MVFYGPFLIKITFFRALVVKNKKIFELQDLKSEGLKKIKIYRVFVRLP